MATENIKEALEYAVELAGNEEKIIKAENGKLYYDENVHSLRELDTRPIPPRLYLNTLDSLVDYLKTDLDQLGSKRVLVVVESPKEVVVYEELDKEANRAKLVTVESMTPDIHFGRYEETSDFNIMLQSRFVDTDDRAIVLDFASALKIDSGLEIVDDGISQTATIKTGVASLGQAKAPNPVTLRPYRTFAEVEQPASQFIYRINKAGHMALFEADGGKWKLDAINNIANYLKSKLEDQVNITILA
ncbi:hypothetical protein BVE84_05620 [Streptococcus azizii]|uniref:Phage protein n=1 Tax=Streptococcus azizii TaxID=1579424 RepID=A0AB36JQ12_9STRE|nr:MULTISPECIES: hypothetical protein [Streptococcus]QBX22519.1 hypothetical protein Javan85_0022 [Streptococcus phage Javan85]QBX31915.1 hypothetical protein Javan84_0038 [Streptococcus phage Javan84]MBF0775984.1 hypothetical protein [Streptococcus sp. 19428wD3_AN2]MBF0788003.1 hypothetical protein [Streptococcus sp. 19428wC2_LYSM12]ONK26320.1 hypothetical protein BVE86_07560 [Streptococcus azizii]